MQNLANGTQTSPHLVDDVRLNEHLVLDDDDGPGSKLDGVAIEEGPRGQSSWSRFIQNSQLSIADR